MPPLAAIGKVAPVASPPPAPAQMFSNITPPPMGMGMGGMISALHKSPMIQDGPEETGRPQIVQTTSGPRVVLPQRQQSNQSNLPNMLGRGLAISGGALRPIKQAMIREYSQSPSIAQSQQKAYPSASAGRLMGSGVGVRGVMKPSPVRSDSVHHQWSAGNRSPVPSGVNLISSHDVEVNYNPKQIPTPANISQRPRGI